MATINLTDTEIRTAVRLGETRDNEATGEVESLPLEDDEISITRNDNGTVTIAVTPMAGASFTILVEAIGGRFRATREKTRRTHADVAEAIARAVSIFA